MNVKETEIVEIINIKSDVKEKEKEDYLLLLNKTFFAIF